MPIVCLVRHGQASFGAADYDALSETGREQARLAGAELARRGVRSPLVVSGTLRRQRDTAALLGLAADADDADDAELVEDARWNEYDHLGLVARRSQAEHRPLPTDSRSFQAALDEALTAWIEAADPDGWTAFAGGAVEALHAVLARLGEGQDAVVVTSGGVVAAVVGTLLGTGAAGVVALNRMMVNASITTLVAGSSGVNVLTYNDHAFLGSARTYR